MINLITYDLKQPDRNYEALYESIKQCGGTWWHYLDSIWLVKTDFTPSQCYDRIRPNIDDNDLLFIVEISGQKRQGWLPKDAWVWIKENE